MIKPVYPMGVEPSTSSLLHGRLSDQRILFLGDSTIRYLYLTVVNMAWLPSERASADWAFCSKSCFWNERTWPSWEAYYRGTSLVANHSFCDCYRADGAYSPAEICENRYNRLPGAQVWLDYLQLLDLSEPLRGSWWPGESDEHRRVHSVFAPRWALHLAIAARTLIGELRPSAIVVNLGHHLSRGQPLLHTRDAPSLARVYGEVAEALHAVTPNVLWVTSIASHEVHGHGLQLEHALVRSHFRNVFNTSEWLSSLSGLGHFFDGSMHLQIHNNVALACGLMRHLHPSLIVSTGARHACHIDVL